MADAGLQGVSPYTKVKLDQTATVGTDTTYPLHFESNKNTGLYLKSAGVLGIGAGGAEVASANSTTFTVPQYLAESSIATGLTAAGTNQATALALASATNWVGLATSGVGCVLPTTAVVGVGGTITIYNDGINAIKVYGSASDSATIDGTAGSTGVTLSATKRCMFMVQAAAKWVSAQLGAVSA